VAPHFGLVQQISLMVMLMLTSKGVAAVPRASFIVLVGALTSFGLPQARRPRSFSASTPLLDMAPHLGERPRQLPRVRRGGPAGRAEFDDQKSRRLPRGQRPQGLTGLSTSPVGT